ncbi:MAG: hypothetical protein JW801_09725 [Bacteroidales bacterium]|nr:hypothetical protein [Bacteroidales bacterium]
MRRGILLLCTILALCGTITLPSEAQIIKTRVDFVGGIAYPEYLHGGIRYQYGERAQAGLYYGGDMGIMPEIINSLTLDHMYHFGKNNYYSNRPVWYTRQAYTYSKQMTTIRIYKISYLDLSLGYEFPLNNYVGLNFDMGLNFKMREREEDRDPDGSVFIDPRWYVGMMARFQIYISI